jgi:uncharacterized protein
MDYGSPIEFDTKALRDDGDVWVFTGYASVFNNVDLGNDRVAPGAFQKSLRERLPLILWQHKHDEPPVGTCIEACEDKRSFQRRGAC